MKTNFNSPGSVGMTGTTLPHADSLPATTPGQTRAGQTTTLSALLKPNHFTTPQFSRTDTEDKSASTPCRLLRTARERFLAQHGPGADVPRGQLLSKETRKALRAAEMARWECYEAVSASA
jgi:hypothetical protein